MTESLVALDAGVGQLRFRDPSRARALAGALTRVCAQIGRSPVSIMHVCGSHEQSIAKFGLRSILPRGLNVIMGPGCPVCVTDVPEVDEAVVLALDGKVIATYGDMVRVPGTVKSLGDAQAEGGRVVVVYSAAGAVDVQSWPTQAKKGRIGFRLDVVVPRGLEAAVADACFRNSTTAGVRWVGRNE